MRQPIILIFILLPFITLCQEQEQRKRIDSTVRSIDKITHKDFTFQATSPTQGGKTQKFHYQYYEKGGRVVKIERSFAHGNEKTKQTFYIQNGSLVFAAEREVLYFERDSSLWAGTFYFDGGKLIDHETLGHGKSEFDDWNPEKEVLMNYRSAMTDVAANKRKRKSG